MYRPSDRDRGREAQIEGGRKKGWGGERNTV